MRPRLRPLSGLDAGFLYLEDSGTPMHVGSLMLLEKPKRRGYDFHRALLEHVGERLPHASALRRVLNHAPLDLGHPMWTDAGTVELSAHILKLKLPKAGTRAQLLALVARLHAERLPRDRPMWLFAVIEGLASGELALYSKIHHALLDGQGGVALARALLDLEAAPPKREAAGAAPEAKPAPRRRDLAGTAVRATVQQFAKLVRALPQTIKVAKDSVGDPRTVIGRIRESVLLAPRTPFNTQVGPGRNFAVASLPLGDVKRVARGFGVSLNDVVMALCSGALRGYMLKNKCLPKQALIAAMPVSLRAPGDSEVNNQVSMVQCPLATHRAEPLERLREINAATGQLKNRLAVFRHLIPTDFPGLAAPLWASGLSRLWARGRVAERLPPLANLAISNVPGPPMDLYLAGARLQHYYPVSIVTHGLALNITVHSYSAWLEFGIVASKDVLPRLDLLAKGIERELAVFLELIPE